MTTKRILQLDNFQKVGNGNIAAELPLDMQFNQGHLLAIILYLVLMIFSAVGNVYVFFSIMRLRRKKGKLGRINILLFNLALADLFVTFIMMPLEIAWNVTVSWRAGDLACRTLSFFRVFGLYLSGFVLICICLDRYFVIVKPVAICDAERRNKKFLVFGWIASVLCSLPQAFIFHVERHPIFQWYEQCVTFNTFPSRDHELAYSLFGFCVMYALPMLTIIYCYTCILCKIHLVGREMQKETGFTNLSTAFLQRAKTKTLKMTILTSLVFCICWTPYNVISLWYWFDKNSALKLDQRLQKSLFVFACTNSCANPIIYGWYHFCGGHSREPEIPPPPQNRLAYLDGNNRNRFVPCGDLPHEQVNKINCIGSVGAEDMRNVRVRENTRSLPTGQGSSLGLNYYSASCSPMEARILSQVSNHSRAGRLSFSHSKRCSLPTSLSCSRKSDIAFKY